MCKDLILKNKEKRIFVIGDIHGCLKETESLVQHLIIAEKFTDQDELIFIGDYIDRGKESSGVIRFLLGLSNDYPSNVTFLKGNHEDMLLSFLGFEGQSGDVFLHNGGDKFLKSYNLNIEQNALKIKEALPKEHIDFFTGLKRIVTVEDFIVVHAGLNPRLPIDEQRDIDTYWIREDFYLNNHDFGKNIIYGHTPYRDIYIDNPYKIGIDTGLVYGNALSCIELKSQMAFQIGYGSKKVYTSSLEKKGKAVKPSIMKVS